MNKFMVIYYYLIKQYKKDYKGHFVDDYEGQDKLTREATKFAIRNTKLVWEESINDRARLPTENN